MKPLHNLILIEIEKVGDKQTTSGLLIPKDRWGEKENIAIILNDYISHDGEVRINDRVLINPYAVMDTHVEGQKLIKFEDILAVL